MGGFGSGGHNRTHGRYESTYRIDSFFLNKHIFQRGNMRYSWTKNGKPSGKIDIIHDGRQEYFIFCYIWNRTESVRNRIDYELIGNNYGGSRMYFLCPRCGRRVRFLCSYDKNFICRSCTGLHYDIQQVCKEDKAIIYIDKLLKALKVDIKGMDNFEKARYKIYFRPKYMRQEKFDLLRKELARQQERFWNSLIKRVHL